MAYTVKKLSELSGVTVRTLRFYEEASLLKPAYYGANGYRYYEEKELLQLQQILFFKELGFTLKQIQKVVGRSDFDQLAALYSHKKAISQEWEKMGRLVKTIDKTIKHLEGKKTMKDKEIFDGFGLVTKAKGGESYFAAEALVLKSAKTPEGTTLEKSEREKIKKDAKAILKQVADLIDKGLEPSSKEIQRLIRKQCEFAGRFHSISQEVYQALAQLYREHPEFKKQLNSIHPQLSEFMALAMNIYAEKNL